jgi:hypothetical protein
MHGLPYNYRPLRPANPYGIAPRRRGYLMFWAMQAASKALIIGRASGRIKAYH